MVSAKNSTIDETPDLSRLRMLARAARAARPGIGQSAGSYEAGVSTWLRTCLILKGVAHTCQPLGLCPEAALVGLVV